MSHAGTSQTEKNESIEEYNKSSEVIEAVRRMCEGAATEALKADLVKVNAEFKAAGLGEITLGR